MRPAAIQLVAPYEPTDPALNARAPVVAMLEPALLLMRRPFGRLGPRLGPHHLLDAMCGSIPRIRGGRDGFTLQKAPGRLGHHLLHKRDNPVQRGGELPAAWFSLVYDDAPHARCLLNDGGGDRERCW